MTIEEEIKSWQENENTIKYGQEISPFECQVGNLIWMWFDGRK